jgi:hypothetical protein
MTDARKAGIARRPIVMAFLGACGAGGLGLLAYEAPSLFGQRYRRTAFDDLLARLPDRESANRLGTAVLAEKRKFSIALSSLDLRNRMAGKSLAQALDDDFAGDRMTIVHGWIMPETLTELCALSAKVS